MKLCILSIVSATGQGPQAPAACNKAALSQSHAVAHPCLDRIALGKQFHDPGGEVRGGRVLLQLVVFCDCVFTKDVPVAVHWPSYDSRKFVLYHIESDEFCCKLGWHRVRRG